MYAGYTDCGAGDQSFYVIVINKQVENLSKYKFNTTFTRYLCWAIRISSDEIRMSNEAILFHVNIRKFIVCGFQFNTFSIFIIFGNP